ncbi:MAG TPA: GGDEF domain-containing protein [Dehalococcoidia bacterium]|nr:GGDEF domain-containing protein [Dehalococcoidia bacterium]
MSDTATKDFVDEALSPERAQAFHSLNRHVWLMRGAGAGLLLAVWAYFAVPQVGEAGFFLDTLVFVILGAYAFVAAFNARRETMALEKKLRLSLIMRNMELEGMTTRDDLTHLFKRRHFFDRLERELQTAKGFQRPLSVLLIDLNDTKQINETYGYKTCDKVLAYFGRFLLDQARASDVPARLGGDEFAIILPDCAEPAAQAAVNRLLQALEKTDAFEEGAITLKLTASVAAAGYPWAADTVDSIMHHAGESLEAHRRAKTAELTAQAGAQSD